MTDNETKMSDDALLTAIAQAESRTWKNHSGYSEEQSSVVVTPSILRKVVCRGTFASVHAP